MNPIRSPLPAPAGKNPAPAGKNPAPAGKNPVPAGKAMSETEAFAALRRLAANPPDLRRMDTFSPQRIQRFRKSACGLDLLYATQRVNEEILSALYALARECEVQAKFQRVVRGEIMNFIVGHESEQRRVLHTASREQFTDLPGAFRTPEAVQAREEAAAQQERLARFLEDLETERIRGTGGSFHTLLNVGIGGSDLGPRALYLALEPWRVSGRQVRFLSNVDPDDTARILEGIDLSRTLVNVVSKSGTTLETLTNEALLRDAFQRAGLEAERHFICVTTPGSAMERSGRYLSTFHMYDYVGGRYSATSAVGGVSLGFGLGMACFRELLRGAREMDQHAEEAPLEENLPLLMALIGVWNRNFLQLPTLAVLPYSQALLRFAAHLQQLDMESNGKRIDRAGKPLTCASGPVVWGEPGTNGQHAFYQLIHQSETVVPCEFIGFRESQSRVDVEVEGTSSQEKLLANLLAQSLALAVGQSHENPNRVFPGNRPNSVLLGQRLTPRTLGALLAAYEHKVVFQGLLWNLNSFDQEGVQLGKTLALRFLERIRTLHQGGSPATQEDPLAWAMLRAARLCGEES